jgi:hypothetical protein
MKILFITAYGGAILNYDLEPGDRENLSNFPEVESLSWILADLASGDVEEFNFELRERTGGADLDYVTKPYGVYKALIEWLNMADVIVTNNANYNISLIIADILRITGENVAGFANSTRIIDLERSLEAANPSETLTVYSIFSLLFTKQLIDDLNVRAFNRAVACCFIKLLSQSPKAAALLPEGSSGADFFDLDLTDNYKPPKLSKIRPFYV